MWKKLRNLAISAQTYGDLSPSLGIRRDVNQWLSNRPNLSQKEWFEQWWRSRGISWELAQFIYDRFGLYSGLDFGRVCPTDSLEADLRFSLVCWFDWEIRLCDDFDGEFGIDLSDRLLALDPLDTVEDWILFFHQLS